MPVNFTEVKRRRKERIEEKYRLEKIQTFHPVPLTERRCPRCGRTDLKPVGDGKRSTVFEYVPAHFIQHEHLQAFGLCRFVRWSGDLHPAAVERIERTAYLGCSASGDVSDHRARIKSNRRRGPLRPLADALAALLSGRPSILCSALVAAL